MPRNVLCAKPNETQSWKIKSNSRKNSEDHNAGFG
jgi:hypothetical protein